MFSTGNRAATRLISHLLTLALAGCDACDPWPEPPPLTSADFEYVVAIPNELDIHVDDNTKDVEVTVVGRVYDTNHNPVVGEVLQFSIDPPSAGLDKTDLPPNMTRLIVRAGPKADKEFTVKVGHSASGLPPLSIPVHVRYSPETLHGVAVPAGSVDKWPMAGLASGEASSVWRSNALRAFVRRAQFAKFDESGVPDVGDEESGTVLSSAHAAWRVPAEWTGSTGTMHVPSTVVPATIQLQPVFLSDNTPGSGGVLPSAQLVTDLQGGADIIETSLVGARVDISPVKIPGIRLDWTIDCSVLGEKLSNSSFPADLRPDPQQLMVYMVDRVPSPPSNLPMECDPSKWTATFPTSHAIFLPVGVVEAQSVAHEIGHALSLYHASWNGGFFHSNLMVEAQTGMGALRDRLSVGQAFRGALHKQSWLVLAGKNKSAELDCVTGNPLCPKLPDDILARMPP